jgi:predicted SprT family Zn-dependent metalloprotease
MFYEAYEKKFGDPDKELKKNISNLVITASSKPRKVKNLYTTEGKHLDEAYVHGLFIKPNFIWLEVVPGSSIEDTALIHELVHYALHITKSEADPDHEGDKYKAWTKEHTTFISHLNYELRELMNGKVSD